MKPVELQDSFILSFDRFLFLALALFSCCFMIWRTSAILRLFEFVPQHKRRVSSQSRRGCSSAESKMGASKVSITTQWSSIPLSTSRTVHMPRANWESHMNGLSSYVARSFTSTSSVSTDMGIACKSDRIFRNLYIIVMSCRALNFLAQKPRFAHHKRVTRHVPLLHRHSGRQESPSRCAQSL